MFLRYFINELLREINRLLKEVNRLLSTQVSFWGAPTHKDVDEFSNFSLQFRNQKSGTKTESGSSIILILKGFMTY